jgi:hypothetical protein
MANPTGYVSGNYSNEDLINIFEPLYNSVGAPTGFVSGNYNKDLSDIFQFRLPFKFLSGSGNNYEGYYLSNGLYILEFYYDINAFTFVPTTNLEIHQLFLVGTGSDWSGGNNGNGGKIISYDGLPISINNNNLFTINVTTGDNFSTVTYITNDVLNLNTTNGVAASGGTSVTPNGTDGIQNTYNSLYYGGGGGYGSTNSAGGNGGKGGGGGGGGAYGDEDGFNGGYGGGDGINSGGSGGTDGNPNGSASQFGGGGGVGKTGDMFNPGKGGDGGIDGGLDRGKGGAAGGTYGGGGGGGNRYGGGGGGSGNNPGTGGTGCVLLIYKIIG